MAIRSKLTTRDETEAPSAQRKATPDRPKVERTEEEKAFRKERVAAAKDALQRSIGVKGEQVAPARAALKQYLQRLNEPRQPNDEQFASLLEAPFKPPPKKKEQLRRF